jgi:hypothetical protein
VDGRTVPKGLDIGYALFGSGRAKRHLAGEFAQYPHLKPALARLHGVFSTYACEEEPESIYAGWIGAVRTVLGPPRSPHIPAFFASEAWRDKSLATALASWVHMRHDFVLYGKQPMAPGCAQSGFLVEPVPEAYSRLAHLAEKLADRGFRGMADLRELCLALESVSRCELAGREWAEGELDRRSRGMAPERDWEYYLTYFGEWLLSYFSTHVWSERPCVVADVFTDSNAGLVLHEATGPFNLIRAACDDEVYSGWVLSYFEFTEENFTRLTDEEWERRVERGEHGRARPEWVKSYMYLK